jgi:formyltetrahydrofolate-dependent phosphoribosylglycinamide formyltransferase
VSGTLRVGVLASGSGSNLQALLDRFNLGDDPSARVVLVVGSRPGIRALDRAGKAGVRAEVLPAAVIDSEDEPEADDVFLLRLMEEADVGLIVLAGYLRLIPATVVRAFWGRMINIHPALLPSFGGHGMYGRRVHEAVIDRGCRVSGVTIHLVNEEYDRGSIVAQWPVPVMEGDDAESLAARVLGIEHRLLPAVVSGIARGRLSLSTAGRARWASPLYPAEMFSAGTEDAVTTLERSASRAETGRSDTTEREDG